ncbi:MAG TPA: phosphotransferase [Candidatus Limnocylindria bacterium]
MTAVLGHARSMRYEVGTNLKGQGTGSPWTCLLPRLDIDAAILIGDIPAKERASVGGLAAHVVTIDGDRAAADFAARPTEALGGHRLDLVLVGHRGPSLLEQRREARSAIASALSPDAAVYYEHSSGSGRPGASPIFAQPHATEELALQPRFGAARAFFPVRDPRLASRLTNLGYLPVTGSQPIRARWANRILARLAGGSGRLARLEVSRSDALDGPPRYIRDIAESAGYPLSGRSWALLAPGDYASQKVLLLVFEPDADQPMSIVKLGTEPRHLDRLLIEADALRALAALDLSPRGRAPSLLFAGEHAGRGVVGESWIRGRSFRGVARDETSPYLQAATEWLSSLAGATARPVPATDVGEALRDLLDRLQATYSIPPDEAAFLDARVSSVEHHQGRLPIVFQHGDPGVWNMLVDESDRVVFLDWESAEANGLPLWDLLYFQRSYGALASRREGPGRGLQAALRHIVTPTALQARFVDDTLRLADRIGLPIQMVEPMLYACWMHRALKQATRRRPATLDSGHYLRLLRALIAHRDAPALRPLMAADLDR